VTRIRRAAVSAGLLGIDENPGAGYLYAVRHANRAATIIKGLGKVPATSPGADSYFRYDLANTHSREPAKWSGRFVLGLAG